MKRALVLGLARSGRAAKEMLEANGVEVVAADRTLGNDTDLGLLDGADVLVKSPGVRGEAPLVVGARERGIPVWSEIELASRFLERPIVGVTGTNGKTTTTELLAQMLAAPSAGNVGRALSELHDAVAEPGSPIVCELSSFQLEDVDTFRAKIAVLLNLEPDHLDRHGTFDAYRAAKLRIFENQTADDVAVVPRGFGPIPGAGRRVEFSADDELPAEPLIPGAHNRENAAAATAAARTAGVSDDAIASALRSFPGVPHHIEEIATVADVRFVNDSKGTNVAAALRAIAALRDSTLHLILGGFGKNESYAPLARALRAGDHAYLVGAAAPEIARALDDANVAYTFCGELAVAFRKAAAAARAGEIVLLSPACASWDQFEDFEARGDEFRRLARGLT